MLEDDIAYFLVDRAVCDPSLLRDVELASVRKHMEVISRLGCLRGIIYETAVRTGYPVREICSELYNSEIDLVITSTHGRTGLKRVLVGSVAEHIVRYAHCPVLVIPRAHAGRPARIRAKKRPVFSKARGEGPPIVNHL